jgi:predicted regulator of Ras-like GTPase activity (Roadblock/LC7/MglB family)
MASRKSNDPAPTSQIAFTQTLKELKDQGDLMASMLVSAEGLAIASVSAPFDTDTMAAMAALIKNVVRQARTQMGLARVDEVSIVDSDKIRLTCRYFVVDGEELILAIVAPPYQAHRRLTNQAIREIRLGWLG